MTEVPLYNRVLLKLSGEGLMGNQDFGLDLLTMEKIAEDTERDTFMSAEEAKDYGLVDAVLDKRV